MDTQSRNLVVPRGKAIFAAYLPGTQTPGPFREMGNCPEFTLTRNAETLPHYGSQGGLKQLDEEIPIDSTLNGTLSTDDMKAENVSYWWMGDVTTVSAVALTDQTETFLLAKAGDIIQLGRTTANPTGARKLTNVECTDGAAVTPATFVLGVDYELEADLGIITILVDQAKFVVNYDTTVSTRKQIAAGVKAVEGEMKFISYNPFGEQSDVTIPRCRLIPNGDLALVSDPASPAWQTMGLNISGLKKGNMAVAYRDGRPA
ncbi:phage tail tube protein [Mesorhizobium sp. ORM6]